MILWLASNLFKDENSRYLDTLRLNALNNKVFLKFDIEDPNILRWIATNNKSDWEEIYRCWISDATKFKQTNIAKVDNDIAISDLHSEIPTLTLQDGAAVSSMPLFLVFENAHNDVEFMKCIVDKTTRAQICRKLNLAEIVTKGGGLGEVKNYIQRQTNPLISKFKTFILTDSDCKNIDVLAPEAEKIRVMCSAQNIMHHVLRRRMIENYLPLKILYEHIPEALRETQPIYNKVQAYYSLSVEQRFCMNLKNGLNDMNGHSNIYENLDTKVKDQLMTGFGALSKWFEKDSFQQLIHDLVHGESDCDEVSQLAIKFKNYIRTPA
ncbi:hypothetical protein HGG63_08655 [Alteromonadaceae bacterium A_SAG1]|nr:hypothetical protein [Alteromonadaceae bacterium A_SAG1]